MAYNRSEISAACGAVIKKFRDALACGALEMSSGRFVSLQYFFQNLPKEDLDDFAEAIADMFRGPKMRTLQSSIARELQQTAFDPPSEIFFANGTAAYYLKSIRELDLIIALICRPSTNPSMAWLALRAAAQEIRDPSAAAAASASASALLSSAPPEFSDRSGPLRPALPQGGAASPAPRRPTSPPRPAALSAGALGPEATPPKAEHPMPAAPAALAAKTGALRPMPPMPTPPGETGRLRAAPVRPSYSESERMRAFGAPSAPGARGMPDFSRAQKLTAVPAGESPEEARLARLLDRQPMSEHVKSQKMVTAGKDPTNPENEIELPEPDPEGGAPASAELAEIGQRLRLLRKASGYTAREMAQRVGVSKLEWERWERGQRRMPEPSRAAVCRILPMAERFL